MKKITFFIFILLSLFQLSCSDEDFDVHDHPQLTTGKDYYNLHCASCHRESGMGQVIKGIPPVLYSNLTHSKMRKKIMNGHEGSKMNVFTNMPKDEARKITRYVTQLGIKSRQ
jgi:mono/diheme cytochrome c family protein